MSVTKLSNEKWETITYGGVSQLSRAEICAAYVDLASAEYKLPKKSFKKVKALYKQCQGYTDLEDFDMEKFDKVTSSMILAFNEVAPYEKYGESDERENKRLLSICYDINATMSKSEITELAKLYTKQKDLGIIHILFTYVYLPIMILACVYNIFIEIYTMMENPGWYFVPNIVSVVLLAFFSILACLALSKKVSNYYSYLKAFFSAYLLYEILDSIRNIIIQKSWIDAIPFPIVTWVVTFYCIRKYYKNREKHIKNYIRRFDDFDEIVPAIYFILITIMCIIIYGVSMYGMFMSSVSYGLFGVFVPIISQFVFMFSMGLGSSYSYMIYFTLALAGVSFMHSDSE